MIFLRYSISNLDRTPFEVWIGEKLNVSNLKKVKVAVKDNYENDWGIEEEVHILSTSSSENCKNGIVNWDNFMMG